MSSLGILAYGSLIDDPGKEIRPLISKCIQEDVITPFKVEFARKSSTRDDAPTLIPVDEGGARVKAVILVLADRVSEKQAKDLLWRRETDNVGTSKPYNPPSNPTEDTVLVKDLKDFCEIDIVLYTEIGRNIDDLSPRRLAELAIQSARAESGAQGRDGISYLLNAKRNGIETPLMPEYENEILKKSGTNSLGKALESLRRGR